MKWLLAAALIPTLLVGGYFASGSLSGASASGSDAGESFVLQTTVRRVITVREHGKVVVKRIPVVVRKSVVKVRSSTQTSIQTVVTTRTLTTRGGVRTVEQKVRVVKYIPVTTKVQLVGGTTATTTTTTTVTHTVPVVQTVTDQSTVVQTITQPAPPAQTVTQTQTVVQTVTQPASTVTVTVTTTSTGP